MSGPNRRRSCGAAAATVAAGLLALPGLLSSRISTAMNDVAQATRTNKTAIRPFMIDVDGAFYLHRHSVEESPMSGTQ